MVRFSKFEIRNSKLVLRIPNSEFPVSSVWRSFEFRFSGWIARLAAMSVAFASSSTAFAQGCAMCYNSAAAAKAAAIQALRSGILILLIPPVLMFIGIFVLAFRRRDRFADQNLPDSDYDRELRDWLGPISKPDIGNSAVDGGRSVESRVSKSSRSGQDSRASKGELVEMSRTGNNRWLHWYATCVAGATFLLILAGALVTSNDAGLSVPDWPTSFGSFRMPSMVGGVLYEHGHRMIAATVGLLTVILALWLWRSEPRRWVRRLGGVAVLAVIAQGVLGGITVLFYLPVTISVGHACLAQLFFCVTVSLALFTRSEWRWPECRWPERRWDDPKIEDLRTPSLRQLSAGTTVAIFLQLMLGAAFRHSGWGIAPHVVGAAVVTWGVLWVMTRVLTTSPQEPRLVRSALLLVGLLVVQVFLGIGSYVMKLAARDAVQPLRPVVVMTTTHVAVGALVLAASLIVTLEVYRLLTGSGEARSIAFAGAPLVGPGKPGGTRPAPTKT